jgi:hypothetical protein
MRQRNAEDAGNVLAGVRLVDEYSWQKNGNFWEMFATNCP